MSRLVVGVRSYLVGEIYDMAALNQKGGVGKTTLAVLNKRDLHHGLPKAGK